jgi:hypothetical protein
MSATILQSGWSSTTAVVPSDTVPLSNPAQVLWVGGAGSLTVITPAGQTVTIASVPAGVVVPVQAATVKATGTTATGIVALF